MQIIEFTHIVLSVFIELIQLKMKPGYIYDNTIETKIKSAIREALSARHVPSIILPIDEIPVSR